MNLLTLLYTCFINCAFAAAFDINSKNNVAVYWGQSSAGFEHSLADYCSTSDVDIVILSFLTHFSGELKLDMSGSCSTKYPNGMLDCPHIGEDIKFCQNRGIKVFLSLGGSSGNYGFSTDEEAEDFADTLWNTFGEGYSETRPYHDAVVDGFDFDIEKGPPTGYTTLANSLRRKFETGSKQYYLSAAPQCDYTDVYDDDILSNAYIDFAFIQFYNNYCSIGPNFNWNSWSDFAKTRAGNRDIKLYLGLPGSPSAAGSGFVDIYTATQAINEVKNDPNFGGVMIWDASEGFNYQSKTGLCYVSSIKNAM